jgi:tetratricopeptide (TPR) repeat protein
MSQTAYLTDPKLHGAMADLYENLPPVPVARSLPENHSLIWECVDRGEASRARAMCDAERDAAHRSKDPSRIAGSMRMHGELLAIRGAGDVAQSEYLQALEIAHSCGDRAEEVRIRAALARVLAFDGPYEEAESVARSAYELATQLGDDRCVVQALVSWGRARLARAEVNQAVPLFFRAMRTARRSHSALMMREAWIDLGLALARMGRGRTAKRLLDNALEQASTDQNKRQSLRAQAALAHAMLIQQNASEALAYALAAIANANSNGYEGYLPSLYELLADVYCQLNDFQGAFHATRQQVDTQRRRMSSQRRHILMLSSLLADARDAT